MKIFFDTNILLDVLLKREKLFEGSAKVWSLSNVKKIHGYISAISVNNLYYIINKLKDRRTAEQFVEQILTDFHIISLTEVVLKNAHRNSSVDFKDMIQYYSAINAKCSFLLTRNISDFPKSNLKIITPEKFIEQFTQKL